jgi:acetyltransferase-like isoleucine patch superfamily enzyme
MAPQISVVMATFNAADALEATLSCLREQSITEFEVVLADGGSTDGTVAVAGKFPELNIRILSEPDKGIADAWNKGVQHARGEWITFLAAGDFLHTRHLQRARDVLSKLDPRSVLFCDVQKISTDGKLLHRIRGQAPSEATIRRGSVGFGHPGSFVHREAFAEVGSFALARRIAMDTDFLLRCYRAGYEFKSFQSSAYMAEGGVSDRRFGDGLIEFFASASELGLMSTEEGRRRAGLLALVRPAFRLLRRIGYGAGRAAKHWLVAGANLVSALIGPAVLRRQWFRLLGFSLGKSASLGLGLSFYRTGNVLLGDRSVVNRNCLLDNRAPIRIGADVSISRDVKIFTAGHDLESPFFEMVASEVTIGDHAVVFAGAMIMPGVSIGSGAVVYPGAVVTRDVPELAIVGGVPARIIGRRCAKPRYRLDYEFPLAQ